MNWQRFLQISGQVVVLIFAILFIVALVNLLLSFFHWPINSNAVTMLGEYLFLQESGVSDTFFALEILQISAAILLFSQVSRRRWLRIVLGLSILLYPGVMIALFMIRTAPAA